jgi:hypothetical protein
MRIYPNVFAEPGYPRTQIDVKIAGCRKAVKADKAARAVFEGPERLYG